MERTNAWSKYTSEKDLKKVMAFGEDYRKFLSQCKTERECIDFFVEKAEAAGYINLEDADGNVYTFVVESYLRGADTEVYQAVEAFNVGDTVDITGFMYWYEGPQVHVTIATVK